MFSITFTGERGSMFDPDAALGWIAGGGLDEGFECPTSMWGEHEYLQSWGNELGRMLNGAHVAVLLTTAIDPKSANWLRGYTLYRFGEQVRIQEQMFLVSQLQQPFDPEVPSRSVPPYESHDEDGNKLSEWTVPLSEVRAFYSREFGGSEPVK